ncbi:porin family protein [Muricauda sp. 2012CJ35-5]|uniref:Porin family protein n=1 Tax=Flagellimonas spongiicola TaxID=2942208 RepID=A0ABT0PNR3_9FLAO|nr:outer membrane beta-barrel protein [Allomuricauda spongiicola]MCL6273018.1 porin family protein [Allomuricauda spongiicola]
MSRLHLIVLGVMMSIFTANSQEFKLGAGLAVGTEASIDEDFMGDPALGVNLRGVYKITDKWGLTGGATYFFSKVPEPLKSTIYVLNFDGTYSFVSNPVLDFYGLVGFDVGYIKMEDTVEGIEADDTLTGMEVGIGIITRFGLFFEAKAEAALEQGQFTLGYLIQL